MTSLFVEGAPGMHGFGGGWVLYPPFASNAGAPGPAADFVILSMHLAGMSSIVGAINFIATIFNMRAPGMTHVSHAAVSVVGAGDGVPAAARPACAGGRADDAADRPQLPHHFLRAVRRRRPDPLPAHLLVLRPPGGLYPHHSRLRHRQSDRLDLFEEADVRLCGHGLRHARDRGARLRGLGASHVHDGHVAEPAALLRVRDHGDRGSDRA